MTDPRETLAAYAEGRLDAEQVAELEAWLRGDRERLRLLVREAVLNRQLAELLHEQNLQAVTADLSDDSQFGALLQSLDAPDETPLAVHLAEPDEPPHPGNQRVPISKQNILSAGSYLLRHSMTPKAVKALAAAAALLLGGVLLYITLIGSGHTPTAPEAATNTQAEPGRHTPPHSVVATLTGQHQAAWLTATGEGALPDQALLAPGDRLTLTKGLAEITMRRGARVLLQAPCTIELLNNDDAVHLHIGKLVGLCQTESSQGFTVHTPSARVVDLGTEFGVEVAADATTRAQVYEGEVAVSAVENGIDVGSPILLRAGHAASITPSSGFVASADLDPGRFVRPETFAALIDERDQAESVLAAHRNWRRNPGLLAAESFIPGAPLSGYGLYREKDFEASKVSLEEQSLTATNDPDTPQIGGRLLFNKDDRSTVFYHLDLSPGGGFDRAGLLTPDGKLVGADGKRVCLSWRACLEEGDPGLDEWFLVSLFAGGEERNADAVMAIGKNYRSGFWGAKHRRAGESGGVTNLTAVNLPSGESMGFEPGTPCRFLVVIDYDEAQGDRVTVYLNPDPTQPLRPGLQWDNLDVRFDRLRIESSRPPGSSSAWSIDELRIGTTVEAVLGG